MAFSPYQKSALQEDEEATRGRCDGPESLWQDKQISFVTNHLKRSSYIVSQTYIATLSSYFKEYNSQDPQS